MRSSHNTSITNDLFAIAANRIDRDRLSMFVKIAIEANQHHLNLMGHTMTPSERFEYEQALNQGVFLSVALSNLR